MKNKNFKFITLSFFIILVILFYGSCSSSLILLRGNGNKIEVTEYTDTNIHKDSVLTLKSKVSIDTDKEN